MSDYSSEPCQFTQVELQEGGAVSGHKQPIEEAPKLYIYWCPHCERQTEHGWHVFRRGNPLIPQNDEEHYCERIEVVRAAALAAADATTADLHRVWKATEREKAELEDEVARLQGIVEDLKTAILLARQQIREGHATDWAVDTLLNALGVKRPVLEDDRRPSFKGI